MQTIYYQLPILIIYLIISIIINKQLNLYLFRKYPKKIEDKYKLAKGELEYNYFAKKSIIQDIMFSNKLNFDDIITRIVWSYRILTIIFFALLILPYFLHA